MATTEGMSTTTSGGSPLAQFAMQKRKKKKRGDVENAADARKPGDKAEDSGDFIKGAIKHPGSLHAALKIPPNQTIPASKIEAAAHSSDANLRRKANFAKTLKGLTKKR
jgi:hypothetical protein